eukprot:TRINITY_DN1213_c0_g1_i4.p1 TRINITY_DN1213_c0_g1~~TRINITY_DN1213_c0_g1_i4.p1  ORF type:complete len:165 (+),score=23.64 TRINITY_DN1213_c0_g1_i4:79-573(+)
MIRRPPRSTLSSSSAASDVYKRQVSTQSTGNKGKDPMSTSTPPRSPTHAEVLRMSAETAEKIDWLHQSHDSIKNIERSRTLDVHGAAAEGREEDMELVIECAPWRLDERDTVCTASLCELTMLAVRARAVDARSKSRSCSSRGSADRSERQSRDNGHDRKHQCE